MGKITQTQYRFFNTGNSMNVYPPNNTSNDWRVFCVPNAISPGVIRQLGIQTLPGTKIYINGSTDGIIVGGTGILEIDCTQGNIPGAITGIRIDPDSMEIINSVPSAYLLVDLIYDDESEGT